MDERRQPRVDLPWLRNLHGAVPEHGLAQGAGAGRELLRRCPCLKQRPRHAPHVSLLWLIGCLLVMLHSDEHQLPGPGVPDVQPHWRIAFSPAFFTCFDTITILTL